MAEGKKSFVLYADQRGIFNKLSDEQAGHLIKHIFSYVNDEDPEGDFVTELSFESIKQQLKRDLDKWSTTKQGRSKAGKASAEARKLKKQQSLTNSTNVNFVQQSSTNPTVTVNDNVTVNVNDNTYKKDLCVSSSSKFVELVTKYESLHRVVKPNTRLKASEVFEGLNKEEQQKSIDVIEGYYDSCEDKTKFRLLDTYLIDKCYNIKGIKTNKRFVLPPINR